MLLDDGQLKSQIIPFIKIISNQLIKLIIQFLGCEISSFIVFGEDISPINRYCWAFRLV